MKNQSNFKLQAGNDSKLTEQKKDELFEIVSFASKSVEPIKKTSLGFMVIKDGKIIETQIKESAV